MTRVIGKWAEDMDRVIAIDGKIPWRSQHEQEHFRERTRGGIVIMGRKTWESLPSAKRPLPDRLNIVVSRGSNVWGAHLLAHSWDEALEQARTIAKPEQDIFVIGGREILDAAMDDLDGCEISCIHTDCSTGEREVVRAPSDISMTADVMEWRQMSPANGPDWELQVYVRERE